MLYNRPPTGSGQIPGFTTPSDNHQSVPQFSASGDPSLQTSPSAVTPTNQLPSPQTSSSFSTPSAGNFASSSSPATGGGMMGSQPLGNPAGSNKPAGNVSGMMGTPPPSTGNPMGAPSGAASPGANEQPSMGSYFNSSNPSTLMRTMVGNTTQSGAAY